MLKMFFNNDPSWTFSEKWLYLKDDMELRTVTIFGKVIIAANEAGLKIDRNGSIFDSSDTPDWVM